MRSASAYQVRASAQGCTGPAPTEAVVRGHGACSRWGLRSHEGSSVMLGWIGLKGRLTCGVVRTLWCLALVPTLAEARAGEVRVWDGRVAGTSEGTVTLGAPPSAVYEVATEYEKWERLFSDVSGVRVESGRRRDARVRFTSHAIGHTITVRFDNEEPRSVRFVLTEGPPGAEAWGRYVLSAGRAGRVTTVHATLYMNVAGIPGWFVSEAAKRRMRAKKLRVDLEDLAERFPID